MNKSRNIFDSIRKNKWMVAFIATAILLVAAVTVAIVIGVTSGPEPEPGYFEGNETGVYYYDVADGEMLLTLSGGNKFTLTGPQTNKTGTYTIDAEGNMVLDYIRDEDGTENAKISGYTLTLQKGTASMPFLKKVNYTVTFNTNGGSDVAALTVVNGKTVAKPADPTKEGYAFLGWYSDSELKNTYNFSSATVTENVTLYARWVHDQVGVGKYTIDFDLGYEGAPEYDEITTIAGLAYNVPTPEREGYTFGGWWISMYEDGNKLSYEYTESTAFDSNTTLYAVWNQTSGTKLASPMASISGNTIKWNAVSGAISYVVVITDAAGNEVYNENVIANVLTFDFDKKAAGDYTVSVVAVSAVAENNSDATLRYIANKALAKVSQFQVIDGILIYNAVNNATSYSVSVECGNPAHNHTDFDNGSSTSFSLANCPMQNGGIKITVTAKASGYASSVSEVYVYNKVLDSIESVVYNAQTDSFVWNAVPAASSYIVTVTAGGNTYTVDNGIKTSFSVAGYTGDITIAVKPVNSGYNSPQATTATCSKVTPAVPSGITVNGTVVSWNAAEGAESYEIKIGDTVHAVTGTSYDLASDALTAGQTYAISVKSIKGAESSEYTEAVSFGYQVMTSTLTYDKNTVYWTPVIGAHTYEVKVNGVVVATVTDASSAKISLTCEGVNTIEVRFTDVAGSEWAKTEVIAHAVIYYPRSNNASVITEYYAIGDVMSLPRNFTYDGYDFVDWYTSPSGAAGNGKLYKEGSVFNEHGGIALFAEWSPKTYNAELQTEGYGITNITDKTNTSVVYTKDFTLPVPSTDNSESQIFAGWYTQPAGYGEKLTDEFGNSVTPYGFTRDTVAYPFFRIILDYVMQPDGTYGVKRGPDFDSATDVVVPVTYRGIAVTTVIENGFANRRNVETISIPDTIEIVGIGAFTGCPKLEAINVYKVEGNTNPKPAYASDNGALLHYDLDAVYLEAFPRAKTGTYVMSDDVQYISSRAFQFASIEKVVIGKGVVSIAKYAFYICTGLTEVEFAEDRTAPVVMEDETFHQCNYITRVKLPKSFNMTGESIATTLNRLKRLETIEVEAGSTKYAAVNGMLTSANRQELIYAPMAVKCENGVFEVPAGVRIIKDGAVANRTGITSIVIPKAVTEIGASAFSNCVNVTSVTFKGNRTSDLEIGNAAFAGIAKLNSVVFEGNEEGTLESGKISIGSNAFSPATAEDATPSLAILRFDSGVNVSIIGQSAFAGQSNLTTITYGENTVVKTIGQNAFMNCSALTEITILKSTTKVETNAFKGCNKVYKVDIQEGTEALVIANKAFADCTALQSIKIPKNVSEFNGAAFDGCTALAEIIVDPANPKFYSESGVVYNAAKTTLIFYPKALILATLRNDAGEVTKAQGVINNLIPTLTEISASVFESNTDLVEIIIPASVNKIGDKAFYGCTSLDTVTFATEGTPATALTIGSGAFQQCSKLNSATFELPSYTTKIGSSAFAGCKFASFEIPAAVTEIGSSAFATNTSLTSITIPTKVTTIGSGAFNGCTKLATVVFEAALDGEVASDVKLGGASGASASSGVFGGCTALKSVTFNDRVNYIGASTFYGCTNANFKTIEISDKVTFIGPSAFYNVKLTSVTIPKSVTTIGDGAFSASAASNGKLTEINFEMGGTNGLTVEANAFKYQGNVESIKFPARLTSIYADKNTSNLKYTDVDTRFTSMSKLAKIEVEVLENYNAKFSAKEGILYENDSNGTPVTLLYCPAINPGTDGTVTIPKTVTYVARGAFYSVTKISTVVFEEYDKNDAEHYGKPLLNIGNDVPTMTSAPSSTNTKYTVFGGSTSNTITKIVFPSHLALLGPIAVGTTKSNITVEFGESSEITLAPYALTNAKFETISIPNVAKFGKGAFTKCTAAKSINFTTTDTLTEISQSLFEGCTKLESYTVPASIEAIGASAFKGCTGLKNITFAPGSKLEVIYSSAFNGCTGLTTVDLTPCTELESLGGESANATGAITKGGQVFYGCTKLASINLAGLDKLTHIGYETFSKTALTSFTFPEALNEVGNEMFAYCESLVEVKLSSGFKPEMLSHKDTLYCYSMFLGCFNLKNIIVPETNNFFSVDEFGALYDKAQTAVYLFPAGAPLTVEVNGEQVKYSIPSTVKTIGDFAFAFFKGDSLLLPDGLEVIGNYAFYCNQLTKVTIPASVRTIGQAAFSVDNSTSDKNDKKYYTTYESQLASVTFEQGSLAEYIGEYAFYKATKLAYVNLPDLITFMGRSAFQGCIELPEVTVPASLKIIARDTFADCENLKVIKFQEGLEKIGSNAFAFPFTKASAPAWTEEEYGVLSVTIPSTVTVIGGGAFDGNALLGSITFAPDSKLVQIGGAAGATEKELTGAASGYTFRATKIKEITLPPLLAEIASNTFNTAATAAHGTLILESITFTGTELKAIPTNFFQQLPALKSVVLPESIESIGNNAFAAGTFGGKPNFKSITIPAAVSSLGTGVFNGCIGLEEIIFAEGSQIVELGNSETTATNMFKGTTSLKSIKLPSGLKVIGANAFEGSGIETIDLPDTITSIGDYAFAGSQIGEIDLPSSVKRIGDHAFDNCDNIVSVTLLGNISYIGDYAFNDCDNLEVATPSFGLEYLGGLAFGYCEKLAEAYIPATVTQLGGNPYVGCTNASLALDPDNVSFKDINGALYNANETTLYYYPATNLAETVEFPVSVTTIAPGAFAGAQMKSIVYPARFGDIPASMFSGCTKLESIVIGNGITSIGDHAFDGCTALTTVSIPASVNYVGNYAFANCTALTTPSFEDKTGTGYYELGTHIFYGCTSLTEAVLPNAWRITLDDATACGMTGDRLNPGPTTQQLEGNIPSYMFANSGVVTANLPARVNQLCTKGVFMNCANLTTVTFGVTQLLHNSSMLGADYFTGCTALPASFAPPYGSGIGGGGGKPRPMF